MTVKPVQMREAWSFYGRHKRARPSLLSGSDPPSVRVAALALACRWLPLVAAGCRHWLVILGAPRRSVYDNFTLVCYLWAARVISGNFTLLSLGKCRNLITAISGTFTHSFAYFRNIMTKIILLNPFPSVRAVGGFLPLPPMTCS